MQACFWGEKLNRSVINYWPCLAKYAQCHPCLLFPRMLRLEILIKREREVRIWRGKVLNAANLNSQFFTLFCGFPWKSQMKRTFFRGLITRGHSKTSLFIKMTFSAPLWAAPVSDRMSVCWKTEALQQHTCMWAKGSPIWVKILFHFLTKHSTCIFLWPIINEL